MPGVVAGVDLTAMGRRAAERARIIAETSRVPLLLVHVIEPVGEAFIEPSLARLMREHQTAHAEKLAAWCRERAGIEVELEVVKGSPSWELVAQGKQAELVVVGSSTMDAFNIGPVARRVAEMATCDVLVVRRQPRGPYRRVVAAVDFSDASRVAVERSLGLFPESQVTVLYSLPARFDPILTSSGLFVEEVEASRATRMARAEEKMAEFSADWDGRLSTLVIDGPPEETIDEVVRRSNADLVVVANRGATATHMVLLGTVAEGLISHAPCDVMVARSRARFRRP